MNELFISPGITIVTNFDETAGTLYDRDKRKKYILNKDFITIMRLFKEGVQEEYFNYSTISEKVKSTYLYLTRNNFISHEKSLNLLFRKEKIKIPLKSIQLEITRHCNLRCRHCYIPNYSGKDELTTDEILNIIDTASNIGVSEFHITGGEPLLNKDIDKILYSIYEKGMHGTLFTNGTLITEKTIQLLRKVKIDKLKISIDGYNPETHDYIRNVKGSFKKTINNIKKLIENNISVEVTSVIHGANYKEADKLISFFKKDLKVPFHIDSYVPVGLGEKNKDALFLSDDEFVEATSTAYTEKFKDYNVSLNKCDTNKTFYCGAGNCYVFITANGDVNFCPSMPSPFTGGNIRKNSLEDIWLNSKFFKRVRNINCKFYTECPVSSICRGGCRNRSQLKYGGIGNPDIQMCKFLYKFTGILPTGLRK